MELFHIRLNALYVQVDTTQMKTKMSALFVMLELIQMKEIKNVQLAKMEPFLQMIEKDAIYVNLEHIQTKELQNV
jgi:hypothetical protein